MIGLLGANPLQAQSPNVLKYWQKAQSIFNSEEPKGALPLYETAYALALKQGERNVAASICVDIATFYYVYDKYPVAIQTCRRGLKLGNQQHPLADTTRFKLYASFGEMYHQLTRPDSMRWYWQKADELIQKNPDLPQQIPLHLAAYYGNRGTWAVEQGDYALTESYYRDRVNLLSQSRTIRSRAIAENQFANFYRRTARLPEAEGFFRASLAHYPTRDMTKGWLLVSIADFYLKQQRPDSVRTLLQQAEQIRDHLTEPNPEFDRYIRQAWGQYYLQRRQWAVAETYLRQTLPLSSATNESGTMPARTWRLLSQLAARQQRWDSAFASADAAIRAVGKPFEQEVARPPLAKVINGPALIQSLRWKADLWYQVAVAQNDPAALGRAVRTYQQTFWLTDQWQTTYRAELSKLFFQEEIRPAYRTGLQAIYRQWSRTQKPADLQRLLQIQEQSKAAILAEQQTVSSKSAPIVRSIERTVDIAQLQSRIDPQSALLHYSLMSEGVLLTVLRSTKITVLTLPLSPTQLKCLTDSLQKAVYHNPDPFLYEGHQVAKQLCDVLIKPVLPALTGVSRLVIVRDGTLHQLPFEVLETTARPGSYLLRQFAISYAYSARTALGFQRNLPQQPPHVLSMAPFVPDAATLPRLRAGNYELLQASQVEANTAGGTVSLGENASKQAFLELVPHHDQLLLSTHAQASSNPAESYISFFPGQTPTANRLYAYEIARLNLHHIRLAIVSACRSGDGRVHDSEGLLSLARAFAQAGCPAVLTSLWEANDQSTADLVGLFYAQLRQGQPTDVALQQAKLALMKQEGANGGFAPPFYWAHLVLMGDNIPVYPPPGLLGLANWPGHIALLLGVIGVGLIGWWVSARFFANRFATALASDQRVQSGK